MRNPLSVRADIHGQPSGYMQIIRAVVCGKVKISVACTVCLHSTTYLLPWIHLCVHSVLVWLLSGGVCSTSPINSTEWEAVGGFVITICKPWYTYVRMKLTQTPWPKHPVLHTCVLSDNFLLLYATAQSPTKSLSYVYHTLNNKLL